MLRSAPSFRATLTCAALAATALLLAGCAADDAPASSPAPSSSAGGSATAAPTEPAETAAPEETATPFSIDCEALVTLEQLYAFNPNVGVDPAYTPDGATVTKVVDQGGTACGYLNQTSGDVLQVAVATPPASVIDAMAGAAAEQSHAVPTYGTPPAVEGYFTQSGNAGEAQVFSGPYWIVIESSLLYEPGDAQQLVADVLGNLPAA